MEERQSQAYESINHETINKDNTYELYRVSATEERRPEEPKNIKKRKNKELTTWNKPIIILATILMSLIVMLLIVIFCLLVAHMSTRDTTCTAGATTTRATIAGNGDPNLTEWAISIVNDYIKLDKQILQTTTDSAQKLINIVNTLSNLQDTSTSTAGVTDDILLIAQELLVLHNDSTALPTSCKQLKSQYPSSPSGYYILASATYTAYCNMGTLCGSGGGWTRLAYLDMSDATQNCPSGFRLYQSGGVRACGRPVTSSGSCVSVQFPSNGISYSQICGRVTGYQYGNTDSLHSLSDLNSCYVDGVSITRGSPCQHVWTLIAGNSESSTSSNACPCNTGSTVSVQSFIGNNYFCESGNPKSGHSYNILYTSDPLWDGQGCGSLESSCCNVPGIPWFHRDYGSTTTTDYIELRVCGDAGSNYEDSPVHSYDIYVK